MPKNIFKLNRHRLFSEGKQSSERSIFSRGFENQQGVVSPVVIIGAVLIIGAILLISNLNKINLGNIPIPSGQKGSASWLYKVDLKSCQAIVDRADLNNYLVVDKDPQATWQHRCSLSPTELASKDFGLDQFSIDAVFDEQGVIDPVGNAVKFQSKEPVINFIDYKYMGKNYKDIYQEPDAITTQYEAFRYDVEHGANNVTIDKKGTFPTTEGQGAYFIIRYENVTVNYTGFSHAKKGSCNIVMGTTYVTLSERSKLEEQLVQMVQKIDKAIISACGKVQTSP